MNVLARQTSERGERLLALHLQSLDPKAVPARERLTAQLDEDLARKLLFALAPYCAA